MKTVFAVSSLTVASFFVGNVAGAAPVTPAPTLNTPQNGAQDWLFNYNNGKFDGFAWNPVKGATFRIVISTNAKFIGFDDRSNGAHCDPAVCITIDTTKNALSKADLANFWWKPGTYYWTVRASTPAGGASAWAPTRSFSTTTSTAALQVQNALTYRIAPPSKTNASYFTDVDPYLGVDYGLGLKNGITTLSNAINSSYASAWAKLKGNAKGTVYDLWVQLGRPVTPAMRTAIGNAIVGYTGSDKASLVQLTIDNYRGTVPANARDAILQYYGMRAQCKEFANRIVAGAGGTTKNYGSAQSANVKPGMYAFKGSEHAAIINAVQWKANGQAYARLSEANASNASWHNPGGETPWLRTVQHTREVAVGSNQTFTVVAN